MRVCATPGCPELSPTTYCATHAPPPWQGTTRRSRLPKDWPKRRANVLRRDRNTCYACGAHATEVDHITPGDNHDYANLAAICTPCHRRKTAREGLAARNR